jgi:hypothetical protein
VNKLFQDIIDKLKDTEQEIKDLKRAKAQSEHLLSLVLHQIGEVEIDFGDLYKVDYKKVKLIPNQENELVKVFYDED